MSAPASVTVEGGEQLVVFYEPCCRGKVHHDCKRCGDIFCPEHQGCADDLDPACGFVGSDVCDFCFGELSAGVTP